MARRLALFDLDNTLLAGDSDHAWGEFLIAKGLVDAEAHQQRNDAFYETYKANQLDIHAYVEFTLGPVTAMSAAEQCQLREEYFAACIEAMMTPASLELVANHQRAGDFCVIITATNSFLTSPIAAAYEVDLLIATDIEFEDGRATGRIVGTPCYQEGKVQRLQQWLEHSASAQQDGMNLKHSIFYSDSSNDLPLLEQAGEAVVVDGDQRLLQVAGERNWKTMSLR